MNPAPHTAGPLRVVPTKLRPEPHFILEECVNASGVRDVNVAHVAREATAAELVRRWNACPALLAACENDVLELSRLTYTVPAEARDRLRDIIVRRRSAIAAAKAGGGA